MAALTQAEFAKLSISDKLDVILHLIAEGAWRDGTAWGGLKTGLQVAGSDIELGAVEIKNATTDDRLSVDAAGAALIRAANLDITLTALAALIIAGPVVVNSELPAAAALTDTDANPTVPGVGAYLMGWDGTQWRRFPLSNATVGGDGTSNSVSVAATSAYNRLFNGATWDRQRIPTIFKAATATAAGDTALWTPTSGKKFRIMRFRLTVRGDSTSAASPVTITLRDNVTALPFGEIVAVPAVANADANRPLTITPWIDLGQGILSATANNVLNINLDNAFTAGGVRVSVAGTEE